jgi:DNA-binding transcriptional ArsR family regulator
VAGSISFLQHDWMSTSHAVQYVMEFLASRVNDLSTRGLLTDMVEANVASIDLSDLKQAGLVDIIADQLPSHVARLVDPQLRGSLTKVFEDLYRYAREQQDYNRDPTKDTYFTIGPNPATYFDIEVLKRSISRHLKKVEYVRIDVSRDTAEQRATVRDYVDELANPRILIVGDI